MFGIAGGMALAGSWMLAHAIWSGVTPEAGDVRPSVAVGLYGAMLTVLGAF